MFACNCNSHRGVCLQGTVDLILLDPYLLVIADGFSILFVGT